MDRYVAVADIGALEKFILEQLALCAEAGALQDGLAFAARGVSLRFFEAKPAPPWLRKPFSGRQGMRWM